MREISAETRSKILARYGMTEWTYQRMFREQNGRCAICRKPPKGVRLCVDHDHKTEQIRALLCRQCNMVLGLIQEDILVAARIFNYLAVHKA